MRDIEIERRSKGYLNAVLKHAQCPACKQVFQNLSLPEIPALCGVGGWEGHIYGKRLFTFLEEKFQIDYIDDDTALCGAPCMELTIYFFPRFLEEELFYRRELREFLFENFRELLEKPILFKHVIAFLEQERSKNKNKKGGVRCYTY